MKYIRIVAKLDKPHTPTLGGAYSEEALPGLTVEEQRRRKQIREQYIDRFELERIEQHRIEEERAEENVPDIDFPL
jgi:hypothetical protein